MAKMPKYARESMIKPDKIGFFFCLSCGKETKRESKLHRNQRCMVCVIKLLRKYQAIAKSIKNKDKTNKGKPSPG